MSLAFFNKTKEDFILVSPMNQANKNKEVPYEWIKVRAGQWMPRSLRYLFLIFFSFFCIRRLKPDCIYSRDIGVVFVYTLFGFKAMYEIHKPFETKIGHRLFSWLAKRIKVVAISQALKDFVVERYEIEEEGVLVAHDGVFLEDYDSLSRKQCRHRLVNEMGVVEEDFTVLYSSNLYKGKGLEIILNAAKELPDVSFAVLGSKDESCSPEDWPENIKYLGRKSPSDVPCFLKGADLLIIPFTKALKTWKYHSALKIFEYMATKVPVLSSNIGSLNEILNEDNSYLFDPEKVGEFVDKVKEIQSNYEEAQERANKAREEVNNYTWDRRIDSILNFITK